MGYDICIRNRVTKRTVSLNDSCYPDIGLSNFEDYGSTYQLGGKTELSTSITYNYAPFLKNAFGKDGIRSIYGISISKAEKKLDRAIKMLSNADCRKKKWTVKYPKYTQKQKDDFFENVGFHIEEPQGYWRCTVPNVLRALEQLKFLVGLAKKLNADSYDADFEIYGD